MRSSSTQIANQSECFGGEYGDVWASGSNSQPASQMKPDRKGIAPAKGDSIPTTRTGHPALDHGPLEQRNASKSPLGFVRYRTHGPSSRASVAAADAAAPAASDHLTARCTAPEVRHFRPAPARRVSHLSSVSRHRPLWPIIRPIHSREYRSRHRCLSSRRGRGNTPARRQSMYRPPSTETLGRSSLPRRQLPEWYRTALPLPQGPLNAIIRRGQAGLGRPAGGATCCWLLRPFSLIAAVAGPHCLTSRWRRAARRRGWSSARGGGWRRRGSR